MVRKNRKLRQKREMKKKRIFFPKPRFNTAKFTLWAALAVLAIIAGVAVLGSVGA